MNDDEWYQNTSIAEMHINTKAHVETLDHVKTWKYMRNMIKHAYRQAIPWEVV
jgi:hypothetical protein